MKRKLCIVTGSRAEFGLLSSLIKDVINDDGLKLQLVVTGSHLSPEYGFTISEIAECGINDITEKIDMRVSSDTAVGITRSMGAGISGFGECYSRIRPDIVLVMGDRFEIFTAVSAAMISRIPVAHLNGGELTEGAIDDQMRHCITKMSHIHFTSTEDHKRRVIQLGEDPKTVFNVGEIGLDDIGRIKLLNKSEFARFTGFKFGKKNIILTFHPVTCEKDLGYGQIVALLKSIKALRDIHVIFTMPNSDIGNRSIFHEINEFVKKNEDRASIFKSLGRLKYLSALQHVDAVVGNSSSGIVEAPSFKIGTVNIGNRQKGRTRAGSVIDCAANADSIINAFKKLYSRDFQTYLKNIVNPYKSSKNSSAMVRYVIKKVDLRDIIKKRFNDIRIPK